MQIEAFYDKSTGTLTYVVYDAASKDAIVGHDYMPGGRELKYSATIAEQKAGNVHVRATTTKDEFVANKQAADEKKAAPRLLFQSVQVNIVAGHLPEPGGTEIRYLKIPINVFPPKHLPSNTDKKQISADDVTGLK